MEQQQLSGFSVISNPCRKKVDKQGQQAVASGATSEDVIFCILKERGYQVIRQHRLDNTSIYGGEIVVDFFVKGIAQFPDGLIIESKWQEVSGSADEKFVFLIENIRSRYTHPTIIICDGGGAREGAVRYLRNQADGQKIFAVYSLQEFLTWAIRNL